MTLTVRAALGLGLAVIGAIVVGLLLARGGSGPTTHLPPRVTEPSRSAPPAGRVPAVRRPFAPTSVWNRPVPAGAPLDPASSRLVARIVRLVDSKPMHGNQWIEIDAYTTPVYEVPADQPKVPVDVAPTGAYADSLRRALRAGVPIPPGAKPASGSDGHMVVVQPATDRMWEFWQARRENGRWRTSWGGAMRRVSRNRGFFDASAWEGAQANWGATATSLPLLGGLMRLHELRAGRIDHALALALPATRREVFARPAQRSDGTSGHRDAMPEGAHLRIDPRFDVSTIRHPLARMMAAAAQRYGMIVRDRTANAPAFFAEPAPKSDPGFYTGEGRLLGGVYPNEALREFPWHRVQVLKMQLRR